MIIGLVQGMVFLVNIMCNLYIFILLLRILLQIVRANRHNPYYHTIGLLTDKPVRWLRAILPKVVMIDIGALVLLLIVELVKLACLSLLVENDFPNIIGLLLWALLDLIKIFINLYFYLIIIFALLTWFDNPKVAVVKAMLFELVEPILVPIRKVLPRCFTIDLSPLLAIVLLQLINIIFVLPLLSNGLHYAFS